MHRTLAYSSSPTGAVRADWDQPTGDARSVWTWKRTEQVRQGTQVNRNTKDHTLCTCRIVPYNLPSMSEPKHVVGADIFPIVLWAPSTPIPDKHGKAPPTCLWASTVLCAPAFTVPGEHGKAPACLSTSIVWQAPTSAIPVEEDATSHVHLTFNSIVGAYHHLVPTGVGS